MTNPDRVELGLQSTLVPENPKKNGFIPRWLRVPAFAARMFLVTLTATPGMVIAADILNHIENSSIVYASSQNVADNSEYNSDQLLSPTPDALATQIAAMQTVVAKAVDEARNQRILKELRETATAIAETPTATPKPTDTATPGPKLNEAVIAIETVVQSRLDEKAAATARAMPSATPTPRPALTPTPVSGDQGKEGGFPWEWVIGVPVLGGTGWVSYKLYERWNIKFRRGRSTGTTVGTAGSTGSSTSAAPNPNIAPSIGSTQPKNPEWVIGQREFERRWQAAKSKLPPVQPGDNGNMQGYVLDRFKAGMSIVHEVSLDDATNVPEMNTRVRAGIEYLIPEIWPDDRIFKSFFDPGFNAGYLTPEDLAKIIYLPESYRNLSSFTKDQKREVNSIRRILLHALHPDLLKSDADPKLQDSIDILLKQLNSDWPLINRLIS